VELTPDVLLLTTELKESSGEISVSLRNDDGRFNSIGTGVYQAIKLGSEVLFSPGYRTTAGIEVSSGLAFWITGWDYISLGPRSAFMIRADDGWSLLERWKARRQYTWASGSKNISQLLNWIHARAGLEFSSFSNSSALVNQYPAFTINPGESGKTAVQRLLAMVPDLVLFRGHNASSLNPQATDASSYAYGSGTTPHPIIGAQYRKDAKKVNRVQVFGEGSED
jgi:hypothetical protein